MCINNIYKQKRRIKMRKLTKLFSVLLVLTLLVGSLASCNKDKKLGKVIDGANAALAEQPYAVDLVIEYKADDADMMAALEALSTPSVKINVDGDKFKARLDLAYGSDENYVTYTFIDGTLYTEWREDGNTVRDSRPYSDEDKAALRDSFGEGANIGTEDFEEVELKSAGKVDRITCTKIKDAPLNALIASLEADLASFDADVAIKNATLDIEIDNGRYNVVVFTCEYFITTSTDSYSLTMTYSSKFNYTKELEIVTPIM